MKKKALMRSHSRDMVEYVPLGEGREEETWVEMRVRVRGNWMHRRLRYIGREADFK